MRKGEKQDGAILTEQVKLGRELKGKIAQLERERDAARDRLLSISPHDQESSRNQQDQNQLKVVPQKVPAANTDVVKRDVEVGKQERESDTGDTGVKKPET